MAYILNGRAKCPECGGDQFKWAPLVEHETAIVACSHCGDVVNLKEALQAGEAQSLAGGFPSLDVNFAALESKLLE